MNNLGDWRKPYLSFYFVWQEARLKDVLLVVNQSDFGLDFAYLKGYFYIDDIITTMTMIYEGELIYLK